MPGPSASNWTFPPEQWFADASVDEIREQCRRVLSSRAHRSDVGETYRECLSHVPKAQRQEVALVWFAEEDVREALGSQFEAVATAALRASQAPEYVIGGLVELESKRGASAQRLFGPMRLEPAQARRVLLELVERGEGAQARALYERWRRRFTPAERVELLEGVALEGGDRLRYEALEAIERADDQVLGEAQRVEWIDLGVRVGEAGQVAAAALEVCAAVERPQECAQWMGAMEALPPYAERLEALRERLRGSLIEELAAVRRDRAEDMGNVELARRHAELLLLTQSQQQAELALSEIVEFAPHDYGARKAYAEVLIARGQVLAGCGQLARAIQLEPSRRETFRQMMGLRRAHPELAEPLRECVVEGVANLPVQRAISIVLTWEDDSADVDLHVREAGGEEVWYQDRESEQGGLLYYDITDGYGPEIYVLGQGEQGPYAIELVYYSGEARRLPAHVTVLRDAGTPKQTRRDEEVVLPEADSDREIDVLRVRLDGP